MEPLKLIRTMPKINIYDHKVKSLKYNGFD